MKQAAWFHPLDDGRVVCDLCPHHCRMRDGQRGICLTRMNRGGTLITENYCRPVSAALDPIEKKPLFHFFPGATIFSTGPNGCTFKCSFCQNCEISQSMIPTVERPARWIADQAGRNGSVGIAYTYSEPTIWHETIMEVGALVREQGLKNVMVTNGFIEEGPLRELLTLVDAMNIDIKSMNPRFYRRLCKGGLSPVLKACETVKTAGCHLEITHLLIPGENDDPSETTALADFIGNRLGRDTPLHISRYFPRHTMHLPPTPDATLARAWEIAKKHLDFVYLGNCTASATEDTRCPGCGTTLIRRRGYYIQKCDTLRANDGAASCARCKTPVRIVC